MRMIMIEQVTNDKSVIIPVDRLGIPFTIENGHTKLYHDCSAIHFS